MNHALQPKAATLQTEVRLRRGLNREAQIACALRDQVGLPIHNATQHEDKYCKVDRWIVYPDRRVALQIKYREVGEDLLFEVYDTWYGFTHPQNQLGRDMFGDAEQYAVLLSDKTTIVIVPTQRAKELLIDMVERAENLGFNYVTEYTKTLNYYEGGFRMQLKVQHDPADNRPKMIAYIPAGLFLAESQAKVYQVNLPEIG